MTSTPAPPGELDRGHRVFVYGTLQFPDVAEVVTGRRLEGTRARLDGFARYQVRGEPFPGIVPAEGATVSGLVYDGIDAAALARIDDFEGTLYRRVGVRVVRVSDDVVLDAKTYVVRPRWRPMLRNRDWDEAAFDRYWRAYYTGRRTREPRRRRSI